MTCLRLCPPPPICCFTFTSHSSTNKSGITTNMGSRKQRQSVVCSLPNSQALTTTRRVATLHITTLSALYFSHNAVALPLPLTDAPPDFRLYSDDVNKYHIFIPQDWQVGAGETNGFKSLTAFYPDAASTSNVSVAITGLGPDFTRLESFGKVDEFAENLVNGLDRSWQRPPGLAAKLLNCKASNGLYYLEYTLQNPGPGESRRHIYSAIGMANNGWYNRLYTVTGQFVEEEGDKYSSKIEKAVKSFRLS